MGSAELQASSGLIVTWSWHSIDWADCHRRVRSLQRRIVQAVKAGAWRKVKRLSYMLVNSFAARALAVKWVTENQGKKTPGMDGELLGHPREESRWSRAPRLLARLSTGTAQADLYPQEKRQTTPSIDPLPSGSSAASGVDGGVTTDSRDHGGQ